MKRKVAVLIALLALLGCAPAPAITPTPGAPSPDLTPIPLQAGYGAADGWYDIYFSEPSGNRGASEGGGIDGPLVDAIGSARASVDVAAYSLTLDSVRQALIEAEQRGVAVRVVMESDNMAGDDVQALIAADIEVIGDGREGLMHNKFIVIDRSDVWTGSMDFTGAGAYYDNSDLIHIHSRELADNYTTEFEEMFKDDLFGPDVRADTPHPDFTIDGTRVESLFTPDDKPAARINELLQSAQRTIYFMAYSLKNDDLGDALIERAQSGVKVSGVMEFQQMRRNPGTEYDKLSRAGIDVRLDGTNQDDMHHNVFIIDDSIVVLGSGNFSVRAEKGNDENVLIIHDRPLAEQFVQEFHRLYERARTQ